jgi:glycosyltransferase involved in cell wall biosynthesis
LRVAICQPVLPRYRLPLFELLGTQPGIELTVYAGLSDGSLESVFQGVNFRAIVAPIKVIRVIPGYELKWQPMRWEAFNPQRYDVVFLTWDVHYIDLPRCLRAARERDIPTILWGHGYSRLRHGINDTLRNRFGRRADAVLLYTRTIAERLIRDYGYERSQVFVAQNAIDQRPIQAARRACLADSDALKEFQRQHGLNPAATVVFVSRLEPNNRIDMLIKALPLLRQTHPLAKVVIIGAGSDRHRLELVAEQLGQSNHVIFTGAIHNENDIAPWMLSATVFCYPDNVGLSLLHAFGYGVPVVTSNKIEAQNPEIEAIEDGVNGLLYRHLDINDMVEKIRLCMEDPALRARLSEAAHRTVMERYTMECMVQGFLDTLRIVDGQIRTVQTPEDLAVQVPSDATQRIKA